MPDPIVQAARVAVTGIREGLAVGKEVEALGKDISALGKADLQARAQYRRAQIVKKPDTHFFEAINEWRRVRDIYVMREEMLNDVKRQFGKKAVDEIVEIEERMKKDWGRIYTEDGLDRQKLFMLKVYCFLAAAVIVFILWINGSIHELAKAM